MAVLKIQKNDSPLVRYVGRSPLGLYAVLADGRRIPAEIASISGGPDAWCRDILFPCDECGVWVSARTLQDDVPGCCPECSAAFWCQNCGGHPDDCGGTSICEQAPA